MILEVGIHDDDLGDDGAELATRRTYTVTRGAISGRKDLSWDDKCRGIGPKVLEEVSQTIKENKRSGCAVMDHSIVAKSHAREYDGKHDKAHVLYGLPAVPRLEVEKWAESLATNGNGVRTLSIKNMVA